MFEQTQGDSEGQGSLGMLQFMGSQRLGRDLMTEQQQQRAPKKSDSSTSLPITSVSSTYTGDSIGPRSTSHSSTQFCA